MLLLIAVLAGAMLLVLAALVSLVLERTRRRADVDERRAIVPPLARVQRLSPDDWGFRWFD